MLVIRLFTLSRLSEKVDRLLDLMAVRTLHSRAQALAKICGYAYYFQQTNPPFEKSGRIHPMHSLL